MAPSGLNGGAQKEARHDEADLAVAFVKLVSPNYPFLAGTAVPVVDAGACALQATTEQQELARVVRATIEAVWQLDESAPLRQLMARIYVPLQEYKILAGGKWRSASMESKARTRLLPTEMTDKIIDQLDLLEYVKQDWAAFASLRLVNRQIRDRAEKLFRDLQHRVTLGAIERAVNLGSKCADFAAHVSPSSILLRTPTLNLCRTPAGVGLVGYMLTSNANLQTLSLCAAKTSGEIRTLPVEQCTTLVHFTVKDVHRWADVDFDYRQIRTLRIIELEGSADRERSPISPSYAWPVWLRDLRLDAMGLEAADMQSIAVLLKEGELNTLELSRNDIGDEGVRMLQLRDNSHLELLVLDTCGLTDAAIDHLAPSTMKALTVLSLADNRLANPSRLLLGRNSTSLALLFLGNNPLVNFDLDLAANTTLRKLVIDGLSLASWGHAVASFRALQRQLASNRTLAHLSLDGCSLTDAMVGQLQLGLNHGLTHLSCQLNPEMTDVGVRAMQLDQSRSLKVVHFNRSPQVSDELAHELSTAQRIVYPGSREVDFNPSWHQM